MFITRKKFRKLQIQTAVVGGIGVITGSTGLAVASMTMIKEHKFEKETNEKIQNIETHVGAIEQSCSKLCKTLIPIQQSMLENGFLSRS